MKKTYKLVVSVAFVLLLLLTVLQQLHFVLKESSSRQCIRSIKKENNHVESSDTKRNDNTHFTKSGQRLEKYSDSKSKKKSIDLNSHSLGTPYIKQQSPAETSTVINLKEDLNISGQNSNTNSDFVAHNGESDALIFESLPTEAKASKPNTQQGLQIENTTIQKFFKYGLSGDISEIMFDLLDKFKAVASEANVTWFLAWGSLMGSYQSHDILQWDDDMDVMTPRASRAALEDAMAQRLSSEYVFEPSNAPRYWKFYSKAGLKTSERWKFPFIDVFTYHEDDEKVWGKFFVYAKDDVFPLAERPFHNRMVPCPRDPRLFLENTYRDLVQDFSVDMCSTGHYNHMLEQDKPDKDIVSLPCEALVDYVPIVRHQRVNKGLQCKEDLMVRGTIISTFVRSAKSIPVC